VIFFHFVLVFIPSDQNKQEKPRSLRSLAKSGFIASYNVNLAVKEQYVALEGQ
jgi:hypothetical protein